jgi:uncharacterized protein (DUF433 family)/predicted HTH domain antitoxin
VSQQLVQTQDLVDSRLYENEEQVIQDALRHLLADRPDLRVSVAVHRYRTDKELSLNQAAAIAGVSLERMKEILERHDVPLRLGPATIGEARAEYTTIAAIVSPLEPDADGVIRIGGTRVTLDTVVAAFQEGATAEEIVYQYPSLELADVYAVLATYLQHRSQVETYLRQRKDQQDEVRSENEARFDPYGIRNRLMSRRAGTKAADHAAVGC